MKVAIDSSVLVGLINPGDLWLDKAVALRRALLDDKAELYYFDCVVAESISVVVRRLHEKGYLTDVEALFGRLDAHIPADFDQITWLRRLARPEDVIS